MKKFTSALLFVTGLLFTGVASAQSDNDPYQLIQQVGEKAFERIAANQEQIKKDPEVLRQIVTDELMPYVDYRYASLKILGKNSVKNSTKEQRKAFTLAMRDYLIQTYAQALTQYKQQKVEFEKPRKLKNKNIASVRATIIDPARPPITIDFKVKRNKKTKTWKAFDMVVEGISLLNSKRAELGGLIRKEGLDKVTEQLKEKSKRPIVLKEL